MLSSVLNSRHRDYSKRRQISEYLKGTLMLQCLYLAAFGLWILPQGVEHVWWVSVCGRFWVQNKQRPFLVCSYLHQSHA